MRKYVIFPEYHLCLKHMYPSVIHKAFLDVTEVGCEAAAATVATMTASRCRIETPSFVVDHPFIFFIKDRKFNNILFMGKVVRL
ncbi:hypothetical protein Avbf_04865 [Armadillidium vulgare]|nr:hypothetical protein Avbf_04865 [Armadillidium vulgare]